MILTINGKVTEDIVASCPHHHHGSLVCIIVFCANATDAVKHAWDLTNR